MMTTANPSPSKKPPLAPEEAKQRAQLYVQQRIRYQQSFYQNRIREFQLNSSAMLLISAVLMFLSSITAALSVSASSPSLACLTAILPATAAMIASFRALYQWERQATLYKDVQLSLDAALLELPDEDYPAPLPVEEYAKALPGLVEKAEEAFKNEAAQWGQMQMSILKEAEDEEDA